VVSDELFFICPVCFAACESGRDCHDHAMVCCQVMAPDDARRRPIQDASGRLLSRAPRWFLEAVGWLPAERSDRVTLANN
jgi:hypothetical protein